MLMTDELKHHGIPGQKWGKRNGPPYPLDSGGKSGSSGKEHRKTDGKDTEKSKPAHKSSSSMSDSELREAINRMELERRYRQLYKELNPKKVSRGKKFVMDVLEKSGKNIAEQVTTYALGTLINKAASKITGDENVVNLNKGKKDKKDKKDD